MTHGGKGKKEKILPCGKTVKKNIFSAVASLGYLFRLVFIFIRT